MTSAVRVGLWGMSLSALGCAPQHAPPPASQATRAASSSATGAPSTMPPAAVSASRARPEPSGATASAAPRALELQGYLGTRPIRATLQSQAEHAPGAELESWSFSGTLRFLDTTTRRLRGKNEGGLAPPVDHLSMGSCSFDMSNDHGAVVSSIEGACALTDGTLSSFRGIARDRAGHEEPFALRWVFAPAVLDRYHRALLHTPRAAHDCAPLVEIEDVLKAKSGSTLVVYRLGFPCSDTSEYTDGDPAPVAGPVYLAAIDEARPERFERTGILLPASEPNQSFQLTRYAWASGIDAFELTQHDHLYKGSSAAHTFWLAVAGARFGTFLALPPTESGPMGACGSSTRTSTLYQVDLDGRAPLDLLVQSSYRLILPGLNCTPEVKTDEVVYTAYTVNEKTLSFVPARLPGKARLEGFVASGRVLVVPHPRPEWWKGP